jgi:hypothetical protein
MAWNSAGGMVLIPVHDESVIMKCNITTKSVTILKDEDGLKYRFMIECESNEVH